ncbi:peptide-methionine (S)-S-oxide reductase MsrA [Salimicrobium flavidum]|uniref:Peptide methionine sulfoxide reductase MsrA n=1 Tax=Salimicrobium flavidum TaxID=570947 RepID=A0A1N7JIB5_9BACI|nr:peptide-methionine (S)-S-oxide reductase MsrA [Salimicrobium flavidum]SIS49075.1 peptide-methionine (S)-S-oxide reductase [Salimicrobium flavidum]
MAIAIFGAGCFWGVEAFFERLNGVTDTTVGYTGGFIENPTYEQVRSGRTGHAESIRITFDPKVLTYEELVEYFLEAHDPTSRNRQGEDVGHQYRSVIFHTNEAQKQLAASKINEWESREIFKRPIVTEVVPASTFYEAEEYHQQYVKKYGAACSAV